MARTANTTAAVAAWPEGQDQPCAFNNHRSFGGLGRWTTCLVMVTALASPPQAITLATTTSHGRRFRAASTTTIRPVVIRAAHEPSQVTAFIAVLSAGVRCVTIVDVM